MTKLTIVTVCKNRLQHLARSLPSFIGQKNTSTVVVDYDCSEGTSAYVSERFPDARVVRIENRPYFNNWAARNAGATHCDSELIAFLDADTVISGSFSEWIFRHIKPGTFGKMPEAPALSVHRDRKLNAASNRLAGLLVLHKAAFDRIGGYDDILQGWGAGGDLDICDRLIFHGHKAVLLPEILVDETIQHSNGDRTRFHKMTISQSHLVGALYRTSKNSLMRQFCRELTRDERIRLYDLCTAQASTPNAKNAAQVDMLVLARKVEGSNYEIRQTISTKIIWTAPPRSSG